MRLPIRNKQPSQMLSLPDLSGGLNMRDGISEVLDNQLTDCINLWWHNGVLRTRAALYQNDSKITLGTSGENSAPKIRQHSCYNTISGAKGQLCSVAYDNKIKFFWNYGNSISAIASIDTAPSSYFVCQYSNMLYCFTVQQEIYSFDISKGAIAKWEAVSKDKIHIPKVMMQCKKHSSSNISSDQISGVMLEGYNLLSDYYTMSYNSYNPDIVTEDNQKHKMQYHILKNVSSYKGKTVKVEFTCNGTPYKHEITITDGQSTWKESKGQEDGLTMEVWKNRITFRDKDGNIATVSDNSEANATITTDGDDDIVITAPYVWGSAQKQKIFNMTRCEWFGGSAGLSGGTRLFLCGNNKANNADLVVWSGLNNPLYFPENSYFYVGNETGAVTGFGKQADKLVIFKENETWFTEYAQNTSITAEDLINQSVIDYASSSVYFPLTQINSNVGCPYPDTIQLCRNRLVWLGNNNSVYTLVSESQYNERNIFSVSEMVKRKIQELIGNRTVSAAACDWDGYYCLLLGDKMLLMDYNCYGYTHVASYSKTEDANIRIPWYYWEVPKGQKLMTIGDCLSVVGITDSDGEFVVISYRFNAEGSADRFLGKETGEYITSAITSSFTTKIFDFSLPHRRKNIEQLNLQLGNNNGEAIDIYFITENGTEQTQVFTDGAETQSYTAGYITSRAVFPCIKQVLRFGLRLECKGALAVDSVILKYRILGGAR